MSPRLYIKSAQPPLVNFTSELDTSYYSIIHRLTTAEASVSREKSSAKHRSSSYLKRDASGSDLERPISSTACRFSAA